MATTKPDLYRVDMEYVSFVGEPSRMVPGYVCPSCYVEHENGEGGNGLHFDDLEGRSVSCEYCEAELPKVEYPWR